MFVQPCSHANKNIQSTNWNLQDEVILNKKCKPKLRLIALQLFLNMSWVYNFHFIFYTNIRQQRKTQNVMQKHFCFPPIKMTQLFCFALDVGQVWLFCLCDNLVITAVGPFKVLQWARYVMVITPLFSHNMSWKWNSLRVWLIQGDAKLLIWFCCGFVRFV